MKLKALIDLPNTSLDSEHGLDRVSYAGLIRHLSLFKFWPTNGARSPKLWSNQEAAICLATVYLGADRKLPLEKFANEAALVKMPTGTGKSAIISVLCRCLPDIRRVLVLTPREALTDQLYRYVRYRFWSTMEIDTTSSAGTFHDDGARAGAPVPDAYVTKLLPSSVRHILNACDTQNRIVLVGTLQALDQIRRTASKKLTGDASADQNILLFNDILRLIASFDLVVVDEGHYEPAISWSRAIRDADLPTILFSATPYRDDYKSFRVRGRFVFNQSIQEALAAKIIRKPVFKVLDDAPSRTKPAQIDAEVRTVDSESEDTERKGDLSDREKADAPRFARALAEATKSIPTPPGVKHPKIIVRADERAKLELLQGEIERETGERVLLIHHAVSRNDDLTRRYKTVRAAQARDDNATVRFWLHQTKLLEGIDDPSFVATAIYDGFGNARQLVQQIGRVLRSSDKKRKSLQHAFVMAEPKLLALMEQSWENYLKFETYCAKNTNYVVANEAALPDRLLRDMPNIQYVEGQFRPRFLLEGALTVDDIRLPASAAVFEMSGGDFDKAELHKEISEALLNQDRFQPIEVDGLPDDAVAVAYYGWRTSPLLTKQFFPEWTLGVCIMVRAGNLVLAHDTQGIVFDGAKLGFGRMDQNLLAAALPATSTKSPVRLVRMSTASLDMSERAIRTQATRTRSFENTFTDLLDPGMVPTSAYGIIGTRGRYLGFARARIRDAFPEPLPLAQYVAWAKDVSAELSVIGRVGNPVFDRYARISPPIDAAQAEAQNILLDLGDSFNDFLYDRDDTALRKSMIDADHDDLCADVVGGEFQIRIDGADFLCTIKFNERTRRYQIRSGDLDSHFHARSPGGRRSASTFTQMLNRSQSFRIIPKASGVVYANGTFYEPQGFAARPDGSIPQLQNVIAIPVLAEIKTEKGEGLFGKPNWTTGSLFGLFKDISDNFEGS